MRGAVPVALFTAGGGIKDECTGVLVELEMEFLFRDSILSASMALKISNLVPKLEMSNSFKWDNSNSNKIAPVILCLANWPALSTSTPIEEKYEETCSGVHELTVTGSKSPLTEDNSARALSISFIVFVWTEDCLVEGSLEIVGLNCWAKESVDDSTGVWLYNPLTPPLENRDTGGGKLVVVELALGVMGLAC